MPSHDHDNPHSTDPGAAAQALEALTDSIRRRWAEAQGRPQVTDAELRRVDLAAFAARLSSATAWLEGELERAAAAQRFALVVVVDAADAQAAHESTCELMNEGSPDQRLVSVGPACPLDDEAES